MTSTNNNSKPIDIEFVKKVLTFIKNGTDLTEQQILDIVNEQAGGQITPFILRDWIRKMKSDGYRIGKKLALCSIPGCLRLKHSSWGYCQKHYKRKWKGQQVHQSNDDPDHYFQILKSRLTEPDQNGCRFYTGRIRQGVGHMHIKTDRYSDHYKKTCILVHRYYFENKPGGRPIKEGHQLVNTCGNRSCVIHWKEAPFGTAQLIRLADFNHNMSKVPKHIKNKAVELFDDGEFTSYHDAAAWVREQGYECASSTVRYWIRDSGRPSETDLEDRLAWHGIDLSQARLDYKRHLANGTMHRNRNKKAKSA